MLVANELSRVFILKDDNGDIRLTDPSEGLDPQAALSPQAVMNFYAQTYPILTTAKIQGPEIRDDEIQYEFVSTLGTKG